MRVEKINGLEDRVFQLIGPYAMDWNFIRQNGNPITTSDKHTWHVLFDAKGKLAGFCSLRFSDTGKNARIGSLFILSGGKTTFSKLISPIIEETGGVSLLAYADSDTKAWFSELGFELTKENVNWYNMRYDDGLRDDAKTA